MTDAPTTSSITAVLQTVRRGTLPPANRLRNAIEMEQMFFSCLVVVLLIAQLLGMWGGYWFLEGFAHPFAAPQPEVFVAVPDAK